MFLIRQATVDDAATLLKLAKMVHFINLPADPDIINRKIIRSRQSLAGSPPSEREREFMFVLEETDTGNIIGTSSVISCLSWPGRPHVFLKVRERRLYSEDLRTGGVHTTVQLDTDESGPSEIGGLILSPAYRGRKEKLGAFLSVVRFHFIGLYREWFANRIIAEMMAPLTPDSRNTLWEYLGRRFINLSYAEADRFCQYSKEFITSLFPKEEMYVSLLPPEARQLIGKVGKETEPAKAMLERLGFRYTGHVDPFDGGPYLEANLNDVPLVTSTRRAPLVSIAPADATLPHEGMVSMHYESNFRVLRTRYAEVDGGISISEEDAKMLHADVGEELGVTPRSVVKDAVPAVGTVAKA
ncbi:MAG TPA: arginine N-succinyltransferase [Phycisphaerales bacterium]|nr:arginine N-succinyltransferase [Phycisphaerales bacterium]HRQ75413.1 arginine N-succinyltransferase [Phycisphaerales bacterium]